MNTIFNSKFVRLLTTFTEKEVKSFDAWLQSPWCNSNKNLIRLLGKIKKYHPHFEDTKLTKEKLFKQILPNGKFSDRRMNNLFSEAFLAAEKFLVFQNLSKDDNLQKDLLTKELQSRHLDDWFFGMAEKEIVRLEEKKPKDWEDHLELLHLHRRIYHHPTSSKRMKPNMLNIVSMGEQLDLVFLLEKAAIINEKIARSRIFKNENHDVSLELKKWLETSKDIEHLALDFYRRRFLFTEENKLEAYFKLRADFLERYEELNKKEQKIHFISLLNDTMLFIKATVLDITESLVLYKVGLKTGIILHKGKLTFNTYAIIVMASNIKKTFSFTEEFMESYTQNLEKHHQPDAKNWAYAHTEYWKGHLDSCLDILLKHEFNMHYFQRLSKLLTTQVYFDLYLKDDAYEDLLFSFFASFEKWLLRGKIQSNFNRKPYLRFIQICRTLTKAYAEPNFDSEKIETLLEGETNIQGTNWLKSKIKTVIALKT